MLNGMTRGKGMGEGGKTEAVVLDAERKWCVDGAGWREWSTGW